MSTKTTADYLDALRARFNAPSDYALRKVTGWHTQHISRYRTLKGSFDDATAEKVAGWLGIPIERVLIDMNAQRARSETVRRAWQKVAATAAALASVYVIFSLPETDAALAFMLAASPADASALYIMLNAGLLFLAALAAWQLTRNRARALTL